MQKITEKLILDIPAHLASEPLPRGKSWQPSSGKRVQSDEKWIQKSYPEIFPGYEEDAFEIIFKDEKYKPTMTSIESILSVEVKKQSKELVHPSYAILKGSDALQNHNFLVFKDAVVVMASQGNCQESPSNRRLQPLAEYAEDRTQGPSSARSTVDATAVRRVHMDSCDMMSAWLKKYDPEGEFFRYGNGYLQPKNGKVAECLELLEKYGEKILLNVQQARVDNAGKEDNHWITQVPCFGFSLGFYDKDSGERPPKDKEKMPALCQKLLELQYQAVAKLAVLKSRQMKKPIALFLTPVGGGVFGNDKKAIAKAIESIEPIIKEANLYVVLSAYRSEEALFYKDNVSFLKNAPTMTHDEMEKQPQLSESFKMETREEVSDETEAGEKSSDLLKDSKQKYSDSLKPSDSDRVSSTTASIITSASTSTSFLSGTASQFFSSVSTTTTTTPVIPKSSDSEAFKIS